MSRSLAARLSALIIALAVLAACGGAVPPPTAPPSLPPPTAPPDLSAATAPAQPRNTMPPGLPVTAAAPDRSPTPRPAGAGIRAANAGTLAVAWTQKEPAPAYAPAFALDGRYLGLADGAHMFHLLQIGDGREVRAVTGVAGAFSADGTVLATVGDRVVSFWDLRNGVRTQQIKLDAPAESFALGQFYAPPLALAYAPTGDLLLAVQKSDAGGVLLWRGLPAATAPVLLEPEDHAESLQFSPDGRTLAVGTGNWQIELWQVAAGTHQRSSAEHGLGVNALAWSPDSAIIADSSHDPGFGLWRAGDLAAIGNLSSVTRVSALAFSPDGALLAVGTNTRMISTDPSENVVDIWDVAHQTRLQTLPGIGEGITGLAFAPDGSALAMTTEAGTCQVWRPR